MILDGKTVAAEMRATLAREVAQAVESGRRAPRLAIVTVGNDMASCVYVRNKKKACDEIGIEVTHVAFSEGCSEAEVIECIERLNEDRTVDGIMVQLPLPEGWDESLIINSIDIIKDVDGLTIANVGALRYGKPIYIPCTARGVMDLLKYYNIEVEGKDVAIVGRSNIVGKPLADLFMAAGATVTHCHSKTNNLAAHLQSADIVVSAIGKPKYLTSKFFGPHTEVIVDVGINRDENGKLCGDIDFTDMQHRCDYITPVPGGVGPMTVAELMQNTVESWHRQEEEE